MLATTLSMESCWNPGEDLSDPLGLLVHQSRLLGADPALVLRGGGNTSLKVEEVDFRGRPVRVLRVKASGSDMRTARRADFAGVRLEDVLPLIEREDMADEEMTAYLAHALVDSPSPRPSIETLLHAFVPAASVAHTHADAVLALANTADAEAILDDAFGAAVLRIPYRRPGFLLAKEVGLAVRARPDARGLVLLNHGLVTWGDTPREAYERHLRLVAEADGFVARRAAPRVFVEQPRLRLDEAARTRVAAALAPVIRGVLSAERRVVARHVATPEVLDFVGSERLAEVAAQGAATPDHILTTKRLPLVVPVADPSDPETLEAAFAGSLRRWREEYRAYVDRWRTSEPMLDPAPRVVLVPGLGAWTTGRDARAAGLARDILLHTVEIARGAEGLSRYRSLPEQEAFRAEYWPLELYKLSLAPPERDLERRVVLVTGAAGAIGRAVALRLAAAGAHVVATDLDGERAEALAAEICQREGADAALGCVLDVTRPESMDAALERAVLQYGGLDLVVSNAGIAHCAALEDLALEEWERSLAVNATGHFLVTRAALRLLRRQGIGGSIVVVASKNVPAPGRDFGAYSASKAAQAQLARVAAIEGAPIGVRVNMVNPDAVFGVSGLWSPEMRQARARAHGIAPGEIEEFYRRRNLLGLEVRAEDVAEAVLFLGGERASRTTGAALPVDGGVPAAFPR
jgi:rhamnulose-1-phosphate aldolase/alcohol dehydrogenase